MGALLGPYGDQVSLSRGPGQRGCVPGLGLVPAGGTLGSFGLRGLPHPLNGQTSECCRRPAGAQRRPFGTGRLRRPRDARVPMAGVGDPSAASGAPMARAVPPASAPSIHLEFPHSARNSTAAGSPGPTSPRTTEGVRRVPPRQLGPGPRWARAGLPGRGERRRGHVPGHRLSTQATARPRGRSMAGAARRGSERARAGAQPRREALTALRGP
jgi:hypothetical protein